MLKRISSLILIAFSLALFPAAGFSHPGRTDSSGGHYVRKSGWGYPVGSYHYHNGGGSSYSSDSSYSSGSSSSSSKKTTAKKKTVKKKVVVPNIVQAKVTEVIDGDTIYVKIGNATDKVRFIGVDTPESTTKHEPYGKEASAYTKQRLLGKTVWLQKDVTKRDKYSRLLAYVWLKKPVKFSGAEIQENMFNAELVRKGYAEVMTVPPNVKYADLFLKFQKAARDKNSGLWGISKSVNLVIN